jgi:hypothetical protein
VPGPLPMPAPHAIIECGRQGHWRTLKASALNFAGGRAASGQQAGAGSACRAAVWGEGA